MVHSRMRRQEPKSMFSNRWDHESVLILSVKTACIVYQEKNALAYVVCVSEKSVANGIAEC